MKTKTSTFIALLVCLTTLNVFSAKVELTTAEIVAKNYFWEATQGSFKLPYDQIELSLFSVKEHNGLILYYIFNINERDGFIIISGDDCALPVIGYSISGGYTGENVPGGLQSLLNAHAKTLYDAGMAGLEASGEVAEEWKRFSVYNPSPSSPKAVLPLLSTLWDQGCAFNAHCPSYLNPYYFQACGRAWAGCGATAMAQIMKYYAFPTTGVGSVTYLDTFPNNTNNVITHNVNFAAATYNYANMPNTLNWWDSLQFHIPQLMYHCGVAVQMDYDTLQSNSYMDNILAGFKNHFRYSGRAQWEWMSDMNVWKTRLKNELNQSRPLFYFGRDISDNGHFWVCDGYDNYDKFHMNWGVFDYNSSGVPTNYNGYFYLTSLIPKPGGINFSYQQAAIFGLIPSGYCGAWANSSDSLAIISFQLNTINNQQTGNYPWLGYNNFENEYATTLQRNNSYTVRINVRYLFAPCASSATCWIDWNQDGDFYDANETVTLNHINDWSRFTPPPIRYFGVYEGVINVPAGASLGTTTLRARVVNAPVAPPCGMTYFGEVEDYGLTIIDGTKPLDQKYPFIFSLDIGSDTELSDPQANLNEIFDPGDCYYNDNVILPAGGADGLVNDVRIFQTDPMPKPGVPGTNAPVGSGGELPYASFFDMDGVDRLVTSLRDKVKGSIIPYFPDMTIHFPDYIYVSFDDDTSPNYTYIQGSVPVNSASPLTSGTFGTTSSKDEIRQIDLQGLSGVTPPPFSPTGNNAVTDEKELHPQLMQNPDNGQSADDDVDAMDVFYNIPDPFVTYFTADHEALYLDPVNNAPLLSSSIYESVGSGLGVFQFVQVINALMMGIFPETDIDAFEFVWLWNSEIQSPALAVLFSVDDDDPLTPLNESGLLNPAMIYYSFLNGASFPFLDEPLDEDIDAIAVSDVSYLAQAIPANWNYSPTASSHLIVIPATVIPSKDYPELSEGDLVGVFYTDESNNEKCGGYTVWTGINNIVLTAFGDDPFTPEVKEGFAEGEGLSWKVFIMNESAEYDARVTYSEEQPNYDGKFYDNGLSALTSLSIVSTASITILEGWSGLSFPVVPTDPDVETIFEPVADDLIILSSMLGVYWPAQNVNSIGNWNTEEGYKIKVEDDVVLSVNGTRPADFVVTLLQGWNILPVISQADVLAANVLNVPELIIAKEIAGSRVYWPSQSVFTLVTLEAGKAYMVKVSADVTLSFASKSLNSGFKIPAGKGIENSPWQTVKPTPSSHVVAVSDQFARLFTHNDLLGVFDKDGRNAGVVRLGNSHEALVIYADDPLTPEKDGMVPGEKMIFRMYCQETGQITDIQPVFDTSQPDFEGTFVQDGMSLADFKTGVADILPMNNSLRIFPNPVKDILNIRLQPVEDEIFQVRLVNSNGVSIYENLMEKDGEMQVNLSGNPNGCYLLIINSDTVFCTKKVIIQR